MNGNENECYSLEEASCFLNINISRLIKIVNHLKIDGYVFKKDGEQKHILSKNDLLIIKKQNILLNSLTFNPATSRQLMALFYLTKINTKNLKISKEIASTLIQKSKDGKDIKNDLLGIVKDQENEEGFFEGEMFLYKEKELKYKEEIDMLKNENEKLENKINNYKNDFTFESIEDIMDLVKNHNESVLLKIEKENNKLENKKEYIMKIIKSEYKIKKEEKEHFDHVYTLFNKLGTKELGRAIVLDSLDDEVLKLLTGLMGAGKILLYIAGEINLSDENQIKRNQYQIVDIDYDKYEDFKKYKVSSFQIPIFKN